MNNVDAILDKACLICGISNRFHRVFWSPFNGHYQRQTIDDCWLELRHGRKFVPSSDHYACIDNLEYLEWKSIQ